MRSGLTSATRPPSRAALVLLALAGVALGLAVPRYAIGDGIERYRGDPLRRTVAVRAYEGAWLLNGSSIGRFLLPVARVEAVELEPGSCARGVDGAGEGTADYTARVRFYTVFALPGPSVRVTCGGWTWIWSWSR